MEVILHSNIPSLGKKYSIVTVRNGYGANYLIPRGLAILATKASKKIALENTKQANHRLTRLKEEAEAAAYQIQELNLALLVKASKSGKIFGSVTPLQVANLLKKHDIKVAHNQVTLLATIKQVGKYDVKVNLGYDVESTFTLEVQSES
ncbi:MAG: 50S ribosomal protein L9 [Bacteroidota bacterium]